MRWQTSWPSIPRNKLTALRVFVVVLRFRNQHRRWPESLVEPGVQAVDPFDDKPLRYRLDGEGFRIWSVGGDKRDDGGHTRTEVEGSDDLVAAYPTIWPTRPHGSQEQR